MHTHCVRQTALLGDNMKIIHFSPLQVHNLDPNTWKSVEVVHIDIADRTQVEPGVSKCFQIGIWLQHASNPTDAFCWL